MADGRFRCPRTSRRRRWRCTSSLPLGLPLACSQALARVRHSVRPISALSPPCYVQEDSVGLNVQKWELPALKIVRRWNGQCRWVHCVRQRSSTPSANIQNESSVTLLTTFPFQSVNITRPLTTILPLIPSLYRFLGSRTAKTLGLHVSGPRGGQ